MRRDTQGAFVATQGGPTTVIFFLIGIIGLGLLAYAGAVALPSDGEERQSLNVLGLAMAILSPIAMGASFMFGTENGQRIARRFQRETGIADQQARIVGGAVSSMLLRVYTMVLQIVLLVFLLVTNSVTFPSLETFEAVWPLLLAAGLLVGVGGSFATIGNTLSEKANLNLLFYFVPFLTLIALSFTNLIAEISSLAFYGCLLVLAANYILTASYGHSLAFRFAIGGICISSGLVLFTTGTGTALKIELVAVTMGLFGILAAFLIDRIGRDGDRLFGTNPEALDKPMPRRRMQALESYGQNVLVLWILAFGSLTLMFVFRTGQNVMFDFFAVVTSVAICYMSLLPLDLMERFSPLWRKRQIDWKEVEYERLVFSLLVSVLFLFALLSLLLIALQFR